MVFYEGGQHLTPTPFGEEPTYAQALLDIQRDTAIYNLYNEWYDFVRTLQTGDAPLQLMNFSFVGGRSAKYGSWGILETMDQDTSLIPAPKYQSTIENMVKACISKTWTGTVNNSWSTTGNWTPSGAPDFNDNVLIPSASVLMPVVNSTEANCNNLMIDNNAILTIEAGMALTVNGNVVINYE
jgi:hypothetical protein